MSSGTEFIEEEIIMIYFVQLLYQWILPPGGLLLLLFAYIIYERVHYRRNHILLSIFLLCFYVLSTGLGADMLVRPLETAYDRPSQLDGDVLLMLGSGAMQDNPDVDGVGQPSPIMAKTILMTAQLYYKTRLPILVSGGGAHDVRISEAQIAARDFQNLGIPHNAIYQEGTSRNTAENAKYSAVICKEQDWDRPILIVAAMHAPRAAMFFKRQGMNVSVYPTHYRRSVEYNNVLSSRLVPSAGNLDDSAMAIKEYMGIVAVKLDIQ